MCIFTSDDAAPLEPSHTADEPQVSTTAASAAHQTVVAFEQAGVRLGGRPIWQGVTFSVRAGECIAILGPNGAGKSTLLKVLLGLVPLSAGTVSVLGAPVRRGNPQIGYLPQRRSFEADVRVRGRDLVRLGLDGWRWGVPLPGLLRRWGSVQAQAEARRVDEVIELVGASHYAQRPVGELSGGEQQRLLIAQALVTRPRLLLLDEPLDSLDLNHQQGVAALIRRLNREQQITVLLVAHDVNPLLAALDRVIYIGRGKTAIGTPQEVITTETLSQLYNAPIEVLRARDGRLVVVGQPEEVNTYAPRSRR